MDEGAGERFESHANDEAAPAPWNPEIFTELTPEEFMEEYQLEGKRARRRGARVAKRLDKAMEAAENDDDGAPGPSGDQYRLSEGQQEDRDLAATEKQFGSFSGEW